MRDVVTRGTGKRAALPHVNVAGKTGSAEDANHALPHAWWVCFAPAEKPVIAIAVMIENAGHGGENALPIAKAVMEARFPVPPKATPTPKP
jgi:cell division protein FtsI/penicillin-binding protein 2